MPSIYNKLKLYSFIFGFLIFAALHRPNDGMAEVYLTKDEALKVIFGDGCIPAYEPHQISAEIIAELKRNEAWVWDRESKVAHFFVCRQEGRSPRFALIDEEVGKHLPITYIVGISADGAVTRVELMVYREEYGWEVREKNFVTQYEGKNLNSELDVGRGIRNIAGATYSTNSVTRGVKRALMLWTKFYGAGLSGTDKASDRSNGDGR